MDNNTRMCGQLALDRCKDYVNNIHAILFLCGQDGAVLNDIALQRLHQLASQLGSELEDGFDLLLNRPNAAGASASGGSNVTPFPLQRRED